MPTNEHLLVKPEKIVAASAGFLEQEVTIPALFQRESIDQYKGAEDDTISVKVEGVLPFHDYEWRSGSANSSTPGVRAGIVFDQYAERKVPVTFGGNVYSAVRLTDEQYDFDLGDWSRLVRPQSKAVARGLQRRCVNVLTGQTYNVVVGDALADLRGSLIEARRVLNAFHVPDTNRYMLVGSDFESALLSEDSLNLAQNVGDAEAEAALTLATIGRRYGFRIVVDQTIGSSDAYAFADSAFILATAAPSVPRSVPFGASTSFEGFALRWVRDYDSEHMQDRSVINCYAGTRSVKDVLVGWDDTNKTEVVSENEHFVRGIKLTLDGASVYPSLTGDAASKELATITGITAPGKHLKGAAKTVAND